jgi:hypothetical protein
VTFNDKTSRLRIQKRDPIVKTNIYKDISSISSPTIKSDPIGSSVLLEASRDEEDQISVEDIYLYGENDSVDIPIKTSISRMPSQDEFRVSGGTGITEEGGNVYDLPLSVRRLDQLTSHPPILTSPEATLGFPERMEWLRIGGSSISDF